MDERGREQAAAYLRLLLGRPGPYRRRWEREARRIRPGELNYDAIARVLASYRELHDPEGVDARHLTETVRRAIKSATVLTARTLNTFIEAFSMEARDAERLWDLLRGSEATIVLSGEMPQIEEPLEPPAAPNWETVSLHELHTLGPNGLPFEHETIQVIRSTIDGLTSYPYRFDTDQLAVSVERGGKITTPVRRVARSLFAIDIQLTNPLLRGQTALLHYRTQFHYATPPDTEFRRGFLGAASDIGVQVRFSPERVPSAVQWAVWDAVDFANVLHEEEVELDAELSAYRHLDAAERTVIGFHWSW